MDAKIRLLIEWSLVRIQPGEPAKIKHLAKKPKIPQIGRVCIVSANELRRSDRSLLIRPKVSQFDSGPSEHRSV
jgi:hypothetical protein